jgi:hypothetical protein
MSFEILFTVLFLSAMAGVFVFEGLRQWIYGFPVRTERQIIAYLRETDLGELKDLLNLADEGYLRLNLSATEFRKEQRHRIAVALEYYGRMAHNSRLAQQWANTEMRRSAQTRNSQVARASRELDNLCIEFRMHVFFTRLKLHAWLFRIKAFPFLSIPFLAEARRIESFDLIYSYERIKQAAEKLSRTCGSSYQMAQGM